MQVSVRINNADHFTSVETGLDVLHLPLFCSGIWLRFTGESRIENARNRDSRAFRNDEGYFDTTQILFGTGNTFYSAAFE